MAVSKKTVEVTTLDSDVTKPSVTAPGDGPADTTDPEERAQSVSPQPGEQALKEGTVNAVKPAPKPRGSAKPKERTETYQATKADGSKVTVRRDINTGKTELVESE